jgi:predicted helicase
LPDLKVKPNNDKEYSLADIYAQTVAYALFTARVFSHIKDKDKDKKTHFDRISAWRQLPETNPFLRKLFEDISNRSSEELGDKLISAIADIFVTLRAAKMETILQDFEQRTNQEDIVIRFYEDFLAAYKPKMRERRGVYYTPEPVVSYMVRSVDILLKDKFNKPLGLADPEVMILDPATGTGTFLLWICQLIHTRFHEEREAIIERVGDITWSEYVRDHLLPRIFGFELLMAPYAIAHLKIGLFLQETGYQFDEGKRLGVYLTNSLDEEHKKSDVLFKEFIAEEGSQAAEIKKDKPIMAVIGNPPYSGVSANMSERAMQMVDAYKMVDGKPLGERKHWLQDDYVKFIRLAQCKIEETGHGILSFVCNHGYLDNTTFRGMRQSLMNTFDEINVLDLHGNIKKKEKAKDGSKDENVFDIQQGVAIGTFVKNIDCQTIPSNIKHLSLLGVRELKYQWLLANNITSQQHTSVKPLSDSYLFIPFNNSFRDEYYRYDKITEIMPVNSTGIVTARDHFVIDIDRDSLLERISEFRDLNKSDAEIRNKFFAGKGVSSKYDDGDTRGWKLPEARKQVQQDENWNTPVVKYTYRPFDSRYIYYTESMVDWHRKNVMRHLLLGDNLGLIIPKQTKEKWDALATNQIIGHKSLSAYDINSLFPLYLYPTTPGEIEMGITRKPNISPEFLAKLEQNLGYIPTPEAIFHYIHAICHSPTYRSRYAEFLKGDFPRVPLTRNVNLFRQLGELGEQLVNLHLMKSPILDQTSSPFINNGGGCIVDAGHPKYENGKVVINKQKDGFMDVPEAVWNFHVGGYQVCHKWLKDRKGRTLSQDDIGHYQKIVVALGQSIELMAKIDAAIPNWPIDAEYN